MNPEQNQNGQMPQQQITQAPIDNRPVVDLSAQNPRPVSPTPQPVQSQMAPQNTIDVKFEDDLVLHVTSDIVDDMRFMELYAQVSDDYMQLAKLLRFMFGNEQFERIFQYYESKGQKFTMTKMEAVFQKFNDDMNSNPDFLRR